MSTEPIQISVHFAAPPEKLFDAFTVKEDLEAWFAGTATVNSVNGGAWRYTFPPAMAASGHFLTVDRPHEIVWTWEESIMDDALEVQPEPVFALPVVTIRYTFEADGEGTLMHIEESGHGTDEIRAMNEQGISGMITTLRAWVENGVGIDWSAAPA